MNLDEAIAWLGNRYVLHPSYDPQPQHSSYALVDVRSTCDRVRHRMKQERSFAGEVEQVRTKLRLLHGKIA